LNGRCPCGNAGGASHTCAQHNTSSVRCVSEASARR
jgi:hypothetical protein